MRNNIYWFGVLLTASALGIGAVHTQAAEPKAMRSDCVVKDITQPATCATAKPIRAAQQISPASARVAKATLDRRTCGRLQTKLERDTCLNRVEATA